MSRLTTHPATSTLQGARQYLRSLAGIHFRLGSGPQSPMESATPTLHATLPPHPPPTGVTLSVPWARAPFQQEWS